ncbi:hypothetical protein AGMMS50284_1380 [Clostridia bacterium]|nr:hypothetical protein AGMMS50284_1380 [Clostridia bacterium]
MAMCIILKMNILKKANDDKLMKNKENGNYRPTYYCEKDKNTGLVWVIPMRSQFEKYQQIYEKQMKKRRECLTITLGTFDGRKAAFLLQNMFPITEYYLDHIHTRNGNPIPVNTYTRKIVKHNMTKLRVLISKGYNVVFPNVRRLEKLIDFLHN